MNHNDSSQESVIIALSFNKIWWNLQDYKIDAYIYRVMWKWKCISCHQSSSPFAVDITYFDQYINFQLYVQLFMFVWIGYRERKTSFCLIYSIYFIHSYRILLTTYDISFAGEFVFLLLLLLLKKLNKLLMYKHIQILFIKTLVL